MNSLEKALKEQIMNCKILNNYRCGVYVKHGGQKAFVMDELMRILKNDIEVERIISASYNKEVRFKNGSILRIITTDNSARGHKNHGAIIDENLPIKALRCIVLPTLIPRWLDETTMEPWEEVEKRIYYCEI